MAAEPRYGMLGLKIGDRVHEPKGCERCGGAGYRGRTGVFEVLEINDDVHALIAARTDSGTIARTAIATGMTTMFEDGIAKCHTGVTTAAEVLRVTTVG
jgi:general secretion pathway protein E